MTIKSEALSFSSLNEIYTHLDFNEALMETLWDIFFDFWPFNCVLFDDGVRVGIVKIINVTPKNKRPGARNETLKKNWLTINIYAE